MSVGKRTSIGHKCFIFKEMGYVELLVSMLCVFIYINTQSILKVTSDSVKHLKE